MKAGNIEPYEKIEVDYCNFFPPKFNVRKTDVSLLLNSFQYPTLDNPQIDYVSFKLDCTYKNVDFNRMINGHTNYFDDMIETEGVNECVIWVDPTRLPNECLASIIENWKVSKISKKDVYLAILVPKTITTQKEDNYTIWRVNSTSLIYNSVTQNPIWYPALTRKKSALLNSLNDFKPYDVFPLIEFPNIVTEMGEKSLSKHALLLERTGTRTRNFIYFDINHPKRSFHQFYKTLNALPKLSPIFNSIITPGGHVKAYLIALISGVLSNSHFYTPKNEIPINNKEDYQGILIIRKIT